MNVDINENVVKSLKIFAEKRKEKKRAIFDSDLKFYNLMKPIIS